MVYDKSNIFARIIRGELPCKRVYEDDFVLAFWDISPQAPIHIVAIPKGEYISFDDFTQTAPAEEKAAFFTAVGHIARHQGLNKQGYRLITNCGAYGGQEIPHFHVHICGGAPLGRMLAGSASL